MPVSHPVVSFHLFSLRFCNRFFFRIGEGAIWFNILLRLKQMAFPPTSVFRTGNTFSSYTFFFSRVRTHEIEIHCSNKVLSCNDVSGRSPVAMVGKPGQSEVLWPEGGTCTSIVPRETSPPAPCLLAAPFLLQFRDVSLSGMFLFLGAARH